ncbi:MAG: Rab family GTPase [Candidatus Thorarchaeota archaeon]
MSAPSYIYKVCVIGDAGVGKSSAVRRYSKGTFNEDYQVTVGVQHSTQSVNINCPEGLTVVKMIVWDLGGQEMFKFVRPVFYKSARGLVLMFDVTNRESFAMLPKWIAEAEENIGHSVPMIIAANKMDLPIHQVTRNEVQVFAQEVGAEFIMTSARTGDNVANLFEQLGVAVYNTRGNIPSSNDASSSNVASTRMSLFQTD